MRSGRRESNDHRVLLQFVAALGVVGTIVSWCLMPRFGRRTLYLSGLSIIFVLLLTVGFLGLKPDDSAVTWAVGGLLLVTTGVFSVFGEKQLTVCDLACSTSVWLTRP